MSDIVSAIRAGQADSDLDSIVDAVKQRREILAVKLMRTITGGVRVVTSGNLRKSAIGLKGTVLRVRQTKVEVIFDRGQYVSAAGLQRQIDHGVPTGIPSTCLTVLEDQTPYVAPPVRNLTAVMVSPPRIVNGATVVDNVPFGDIDDEVRFRRVRRGR